MNCKKPKKTKKNQSDAYKRKIGKGYFVYVDFFKICQIENDPAQHWKNKIVEPDERQQKWDS